MSGLLALNFYSPLFVDQLKRGEPVQNPDRIVTMRVAADTN